MRLLIIADDFTGALDTGVKFAAYGVRTRVVVGTEIDFTAVQEEILVVDTETRHLTKKQAYDTVAQLSIKAEQAKVAYIYKKTDSALRGNVGAELEALWRVSGQKRLPFQPAFPEMNRVTVNGIHFIDGVPATESPFGADPFEPVRHSKVTELIAEQSDAPTQSLRALKTDTSWKQLEGILVFDAENETDLMNTGRQLLDHGELHIMAGCAGFATVLPELLGIKADIMQQVPDLDPRLLIICGSVNPITVNQLKEADKAGFAHIYLTPEQKLEPCYWHSKQGQKEVEAICQRLKENPHCMIDSNDANGNELTKSYANRKGFQTEDIRQGISKSIGYLVGELFMNPALGTLLITGGDTLLQCMECIGIKELEPVCELENGVVLSKFTYKDCSRYVISKSGGFGPKTLLVDLSRKISKMNNINN